MFTLISPSLRVPYLIIYKLGRIGVSYPESVKGVLVSIADNI